MEHLGTRRKIDLYSNIGKTSLKYLREFASTREHQNFRSIVQLKKFYDMNEENVKLHLAGLYNAAIDNKKLNAKSNKKLFTQFADYSAFDTVNKQQQATKVIQKQFQRKLIAKRYKLAYTASAHNRYFAYTIPSYGGWLEHFSIDGLPVEMVTKNVRKYAKQVTNYASLTIMNSLTRFHNVRLYAIVTFKCFNTQTNQSFESGFNLGRNDISTFREFNNYLTDGISRGFEIMNEKDYIRVYGIGDISLHVMQYNPFSGGSYKPLPDFIAKSKSIINIKNDDNLCFLWCCIASRHLPERDAERVSKYKPFINEFQYSDSDFPMALKNISKFETQNNVCVNVFTIDKKTKVPLYISKNKNAETINLFYHDDHFSLIKNFQRFVGGGHQFVCYRCFKSYRNKECFDKHSTVCQELNENGSYVTTPKEDTKTKFNNYKRQKRLPVVIYADFESSLRETNTITKNNVSTEKHYVTAKHEANSFRIRIVSDVELGIPLDYTYSGDKSSVEFVRKLVQLDTEITDVLNVLNEKNRFPKLNRYEENQFKSAVNCCFCNEKLLDDRVRDHCHFTGKYQGAAHKKCNIKAIQMFKGKTEEQAHIEIPCFFHNANYDIRCFINAFSEITNGDGIERISGVPCNMEFFKCLQLNNICIKDSYAHLTSSLDKLLKNLPDDKKKLLKTITGGNEKRFNMVNKKGFYPYEFVDCVEKLQTPISEIKREHFDSKLTLSKLSDDDWNHVQNVIKEFGFKTLQEYHDLYLNIDVYGLADIFEYHRELSFQTYGLDPAHYIGLPALSWDAGLKFTGVQLENVADIDKIMFFEKMKRGGISVISKRYAKANNPYLPDYKPEQEKSYILQLDCNNLYGWAMMQKLPVANFEWVTDFDINSYDKNGDIGYVLEVDMQYPEELHATHNDYPLAPEHLEINKCRKLCPNLQDKKNYYVNIDNLLYYIEKGMVLEKIHRVIRFDRKAWLKPYIDKNSALRQKASNDFEKDFYKLMNNAFYGKTMENERDRVKIQFCMDETSFAKHTSSPLFANQILVIKSDGLCLVKTHQKTVRLQKPIYTGAIVLEMSKLLMFQFHYDTMMQAYPSAEMCKTDTDSLLYYIKTDDVYKDMQTNATLQEKIEFSNYPKDHHLYNCDRKKVPGYFQDECVDDGKFVVISEYVGLRAKSYVNKLYDPSEKEFTDKKKSKGVSSVHIKKRINYDDYYKVLTEKSEKRLDNITSFRSIGLHTYTISMNKIALSGNDDKRIILKNGIDTYAYGYKSQK